MLLEAYFVSDLVTCTHPDTISYWNFKFLGCV